MTAKKGVFLTAEWRKLALAQYAVDEQILLKYLPPHTELDSWNGKYYVSLVGFMFMNVKLLGFNIPFHTNFEEVNLRFYVRYKHDKEWKRGVVFVKEIVPLPAITFVANTIYKEKYQTLPMKHVWVEQENQLEVDYLWKSETWHNFRLLPMQRQKKLHRVAKKNLLPNITGDTQKLAAIKPLNMG